MMKSNRTGNKVLGTFIDALNWKESILQIIHWGLNNNQRSVCLCNVHSSVTALDNLELAQALGESDMVLPDGAPVAWVMRKTGYPGQTRIAGPDLMWQLCKASEQQRISIFLFGSTPETLASLATNLIKAFPNLLISGSLSPKFGTWTHEEEIQYRNAINDSGAGLIFIGLGCPKQEIWMYNNRQHINGVLLGVGAAFDFHAGVIKRAPKLLQKLGLEWLHRMLSEPGRLWKRYLTTNSRFIYRATIQLLQR